MSARCLPPLAIRADAGGRHGSGHIMRMLALAQAYRELGGGVHFLHASCPEGLICRIREEGFGECLLEVDELGSEMDSEMTCRVAKELGARWLVLDGYHFGIEYQRAARAEGLRVLCVDDFGHCERWACNAYLNQNLGAEEGSPPGSELDGMDVMRGARYMLLRREFVEAAPSSSPWGPVRRILITMGGVDPINATLSVLQLLEQVEVEGLEIRALLGPGNPHVAEVRAHRSRHRVECVPATTDMVSQYRWAEGVISAGGSSCWEWLYLGIPGAVVTIADNQVKVVKELEKRKLVHALGWPEEFGDAEVGAGLGAWLRDPATVVDESAARALVDGHGAGRVARFLSDELVLRLAGEADAALYFKWVNDPEVRAHALIRKEIAWGEHYQWFSAKVASPDAVLLVGERGGATVGQVRFEKRDQECWEVGISVDAAARGTGVGRGLLRAGLDEFRTKFGAPVLARIRPENEASRQLFQRAGFSLSSTSEDGVESYLFEGEE